MLIRNKIFSSMATTAMFWRYERKLVKAIVVGLSVQWESVA